MKKIAVFDLDKTVYDGASMQSFLFEYLIPQRKISFLVLIEALILIFRYKFKLISHNQASKQTISISAKVMAGKTIDELKSWQENFFTIDRMYSHIPKLFSMLKKKGYDIYLISASIEPIVTACADVLNVKSFSSNLVINNNVYTGVIDKLMNQEEKSKVVDMLMKNSKEKVYSLGFGDSSGDLAMLKRVDKGFLFEPFEEDTIEFAKEVKIEIVNRENIVKIVEKYI